MFFINFANEIADEEEIELYGKVVPVSAIEKPTPPEGEDYEWADEVTLPIIVGSCVLVTPVRLRALV